MQLRVVPNRPEFLQHVDTFSPGTAMGQQQTFSVFGLNVRYWGRSGHHFEGARGLLLAKTGHRLVIFEYRRIIIAARGY